MASFPTNSQKDLVRRGTVASAIALVALLLASCAGSLTDSGDVVAADYDAPAQVIAEGLDNPRGIAVAPDGAVLVAEAGVGGEGPCFGGPEGDVCFGSSGAVTRIGRAGQERIIEGLPSLAGEGGFGSTGVHDVSVLGNGNLYLVTGLGNDPAVRDSELPDAGLGYLWRGSQARGTVDAVADIAGWERDMNPDGGYPDSNPYGVLAVPGGQVVADAGGNSLLWVSQDGDVETLAVFPDVLADAPPFLGLPPGTQIPMQAVPTSVARGPDGAYYVGQLTGFPFPVGGANVFRVVPGQEPEIYASGFTNIIDVAFGPDGQLYVLEITTNGLLAADPGDPGSLGGALKRYHDGATETVLGPDDGLIVPGGLAFGKDGELYITNFSVFPGGGQVLRLDP